MMWPAEIHCHDNQHWFGGGPPSWRPGGVTRELYGELFRACSYCGSMHPEDLLHWLAQGATLHGTDWKYGWPHKFYVEGIPNPHAGKLVKMGGTSYGASTPTPEERADPRNVNWKVYAKIWVGGHDGHEHECWSCDHLSEAPAHVPAKFYTTHLKDLPPEPLARMTDAIEQHGGIRFWMHDGSLMYRAPYRGYQKP